MGINWNEKRIQANSHFQRIVNVENRKDMIAFIEKHFKYTERYRTYIAHNFKIYNLPIPKEEQDALYEMLDVPDAYFDIEMAMCEWSKGYASSAYEEYNAYWAGRSSGYLILDDIKEWDVLYPEELDDDALRDVVRIVQEFDEMADNILEIVRYMAQNCEVYEESVIITKAVKQIREKEIA